MKKLGSTVVLFAVVGVFLHVGCFAQNTWEWVHPLPQGNNLIDVCCLDTLNAVAVGSYGSILRTTDAGAHWTRRPSETTLALNAVAFSTPDRGIAVGDWGGISRTTDGGWSWVRSQRTTSDLLAICALDSVTYTAVGREGTIMRTEDHGKTWLLQSSGTTNDLFQVCFTDPHNGFAVGDSGIILHTSDAGQTWQRQRGEANRQLRSVAFADPYRGIAVGETILRTTDGGMSWTEVDGDFGSILLDIIYHGDGTVICAGSEGCILRSDNDGMDWICTTITSEAGPNSLHAISFAGARLGLIIGSNPGFSSILRTTDGGKEWEDLSYGRIDRLSSISFGSKTHAIAVGGGGWALRTTDAGDHWKSHAIGIRRTLNGVHCLDSILAVAVGDRGCIIRTTDGGMTWQEQSSGTSASMMAAFCIDEGTAYVVGVDGTVLHTTNGGVQWTKQTSGTQAYLQAIDFVDERTGMAAGGGTIIRTDDGGARWKVQQIEGAGNLQSVCYIDPLRAFASGSGLVYRTTDGGESWTLVRSTALSGSWGLTSIRFADQHQGVVVGGSGMIISTTDGGSTWKDDIAWTNQTLNGVGYNGESVFLAVGSNGTILRTTTSGVSWVEHQPPSRSSFILEQNYPNPFNPSTTIQYTLRMPQRVSLVVTDPFGREVQRLLDGSIEEAGTHHVQFDAGGLPSGVYFYSLIADGNLITRKMAVLR